VGTHIRRRRHDGHTDALDLCTAERTGHEGAYQRRCQGLIHFSIHQMLKWGADQVHNAPILKTAEGGSYERIVTTDVYQTLTHSPD
jgi:hypothetical protein